MLVSIRRAPANGREFDVPDPDEPSSIIIYDDLSDDNSSFIRPRARARPVTGDRTHILESLIASTSKPHGPILSIRHTGNSKVAKRIPLAGQTCKSLTKICSKLVGFTDIEIYYWRAQFRCWTEARASDSLRLMEQDVRGRAVVHVFVLRRPLEKIAHLPFMRVDGFLLGDVVPVEGRREPCIDSDEASRLLEILYETERRGSV